MTITACLTLNVTKIEELVVFYQSYQITKFFCYYILDGQASIISDKKKFRFRVKSKYLEFR